MLRLDTTNIKNTRPKRRWRFWPRIFRIPSIFPRLVQPLLFMMTYNHKLAYTDTVWLSSLRRQLRLMALKHSDTLLAEVLVRNHTETSCLTNQKQKYSNWVNKQIYKQTKKPYKVPFIVIMINIVYFVYRITTPRSRRQSSKY